MHKLKKTVSILLTLLLLLSAAAVAPVSVNAVWETTDYDDVFDYYVNYAWDSYFITAYHGPGGAVTIPVDTVFGYPVNGIDEGAFRNNDDITSVFMGEDVYEGIYDYAF